MKIARPQVSARRVGALIALGLLVGAARPAAAASLSEAQVRAFVAQQARAWNAGELDRYFRGFAADAVFVDQYRTPAGQIVPYGRSNLGQARTQSRKFRAGAKVADSETIVRIALTPDGRGAQVASQLVSRVQTGGRARTSCAERRQELVLVAGQLKSRGQTDTFRPCAGSERGR